MALTLGSVLSIANLRWAGLKKLLLGRMVASSFSNLAMENVHFSRYMP